MKRLHTIVIASTAGLAVLLPTQAHAGGYSHPDAAHDVVAETESGAQTKVPDRTEGDVTASAVRYLPRRLVVSLQYAELTQTPDLVGHVIRVRTNERTIRDVSLMAGKGDWAGKATMTKPNGKTVRCRITSKIDYAHNWASVSIPRRCLSRPRWVRVGSGIATVQGGTYYADDAFTNGVIRDNPVYGPKVFRD